MAGRVIIYGELADRYEAERLLAERFPELHVETFARSWDFVERACQGEFDVAVLLPGPIAQHARRIETVAALRRNSFSGRILVSGSFLTERHDALAAEADYVLDPAEQETENVVEAALFRPHLAADHPYLRFLFHGEWACIEAYGDELPAKPPDVLLAATSCHPAGDFFHRLAAYCKAHDALRCIVVEDDGGEDACVEALATGQHHVVLADEGLMQVVVLGRRFLRECWLARMAKA